MGAGVSYSSGESSDSGSFSGSGLTIFCVVMGVCGAFICTIFLCVHQCVKKDKLRLKEVKERERQELVEWKRSRAGNRVRKIAKDMIAVVDKEFAEQTSERKKLKGIAALAHSVSLPVGDHKEREIAMERRRPTPASETSTVIDMSRGDVHKADRRTVLAAQLVLEIMEQELAASNLIGAVMGVRLISDPSSGTPEYSRFCVPLQDIPPKPLNRRLTRAERYQRSVKKSANNTYMQHYDFFAGHSLAPEKCADQLKVTQI